MWSAVAAIHITTAIADLVRRSDIELQTTTIHLLHHWVGYRGWVLLSGGAAMIAADRRRCFAMLEFSATTSRASAATLFLAHAPHAKVDPVSGATVATTATQ